jgi:Flp pilus assembly protein TadD
VRLVLPLPAVLAIATGCGFGEYEVVRVHAGRTRVGRFVSSTAYEAGFEAAVAEAEGDWPRAVDALRRASDEDPDAADLRARLGLALCHTKRFDAGRVAIEEALRIEPDLERGWSARARCTLLSNPKATAAARADLARALEADGEAVEPTLMLAELDLEAGDLAAARLRAEEAVLLHPWSSAAHRLLAVVAARQGDTRRATIAALSTASLDRELGARTKREIYEAVARSGLARDALALARVVHPADPISKEGEADAPPADRKIEGACAARIESLEAIARSADEAAIHAAADGVRALCPAHEGRITGIEVAAIWSPENAEAVERHARAATSNAVRRWAARMALRRLPLDAIEAVARDGALPPAEDRATLALHLAVAARGRIGSAPSDALALARAARDLAPAEPTVARLAADVARKAGAPTSDPARVAACALARTAIERDACPAP